MSQKMIYIAMVKKDIYIFLIINSFNKYLLSPLISSPCFRYICMSNRSEEALYHHLDDAVIERIRKSISSIRNKNFV